MFKPSKGHTTAAEYLLRYLAGMTNFDPIFKTGGPQANGAFATQTGVTTRTTATRLLHALPSLSNGSISFKLGAARTGGAIDNEGRDRAHSTYDE